MLIWKHKLNGYLFTVSSLFHGHTTTWFTFIYVKCNFTSKLLNC